MDCLLAPFLFYNTRTYLCTIQKLHCFLLLLLLTLFVPCFLTSALGVPCVTASRLQPTTTTTTLERSIIWEKNFRGYMDERESRKRMRERDQQTSGSSDRYTQGGKLRRKYSKRLQAQPAGAAGAGGVGGVGGGVAGSVGSTTAQQAVFAAQQAQQANKSSKKINYDALKVVFDISRSSLLFFSRLDFPLFCFCWLCFSLFPLYSFCGSKYQCT
jgi:hypothetical protein